MASSLPNSPITGSGNVSRSDSINSEDVIRLYRDQENIDVSSYFKDCANVLILQCRDTGYRFYYPFTIAGDEAFYQNLAAEIKGRDLDYDRDWSDDHEFALSNIGRDELVLEIGCNTGKFLDRVREKTRRVVGLEFNSQAAAIARSKDLDVRNIDIKSLATHEPESFDTVCAFQVLEHITDAGEFLRNCLSVLKPGGKLILSVPNNTPYFQRFSKYEVLNLPPHHLGLWNFDAFNSLGGFFDMDLIAHDFFGGTGIRGNAYLRAMHMVGIRSSAQQRTTLEKVKLALAAPLSLLISAFESVIGQQSFAFVTVVFRKQNPISSR